MAAKENNSFLFRNFSVLFSGLFAVQVINFLFSLVLPRFFTPQAFAEFGVFSSLVFILIEIVNAKLDMAVMLPAAHQDSRSIIDASFTFAFILCSLLLAVSLPLYLFYNKLSPLIPITVFLYGIHQPILVYLNKTGHYRAINRFRILQVISTGIVTLGLGMEGIPHALVYGFICGIFLATLYTIRFVRPAYKLSGLQETIRKYVQFPKYGTWSSLLNTISRNIVPVLLLQFFPSGMVGYYSYATRLLNAPTGMFSSALGQVYFKTASEQSREDLRATTQKIIRYTFLAGILPSLLILFFGKALFFALFSGEWIEAGKISQYLILWYLLGVITSPISVLLDVRQKLQFEFRYNLVLLLSRVAAILAGGLLHDFYLAIFLFTASGIVMNAFLLYYLQFILLKE